VKFNFDIAMAEELKLGMTGTISFIAEIISLCMQRPDLEELARGKLAHIAGETRPNGRAQDAIHEYRRRKAAEPGGHRSAFPQTSDIRTWAQQIAKLREIPFQRKEMRHLRKILHWLDENWDKVGSDFQILLDNDEVNGRP
jgi:hypothetical protein